MRLDGPTLAKNVPSWLWLRKTASIRGFRRTYLEVKDDDDDEGAEDEEQEVHPQDVNSDVDAIQPQSGRTQLDREGPSVVVELQDLRGILPLPIWLRERKGM